MKLIKNNFVEIDFTARVRDTGIVFDTTLLDEAKKAGLVSEEKEKEIGRFKPLRICISQGMIIRGVDNALIGKEIGREYSVEVEARDAFGERDNKLLRIIPLSAFKNQGFEPAPGMVLTLDNMLVRISSVTSGRVLVDFNNPLAGKAVVYKLKINKEIENEKEKLELLAEFFLHTRDVSVEDKKAIIKIEFQLPKNIEDDFKRRIKEILNLDCEFQLKKKQEQKKEKQVEESREEEKATGVEKKSEFPNSQSAVKQQEKQLIYILVGIAVVFALTFLGVYIFKQSSTFKYNDMKFEKLKMGDLNLYRTKLSLSKAEGKFSLDLYFYNDPRELSKIPFNTTLTLRKQGFVSFQPEIVDCYASNIASSELGTFLGALGMRAKGTTTNSSYAEEHNLTKADCNDAVARTVIVLKEGNENSIERNGECYTINIANCRVLEAVERFILGSTEELIKQTKR